MENPKAEFRTFCLDSKKVNRYLFSKKIGQLLYEISKPYKRILLFIPLLNEADIYFVLKRLRKEKKEIFVPLVDGEGFKMVKYSLPLKKNKFSIFEPQNKNTARVKIDLAIVPVVGIDKSFKRVGFGKGMYDRFFSKLPYRPKIVFLQLRPCVSLKKVTDFYDIKGDEYISFNIRRKNDNRNYSRFFFIRSRGVFYNKKDG